MWLDWEIGVVVGKWMVGRDWEVWVGVCWL